MSTMMWHCQGLLRLCYVTKTKIKGCHAYMMWHNQGLSCLLWCDIVKGCYAYMIWHNKGLLCQLWGDIFKGCHAYMIWHHEWLLCQYERHHATCRWCQSATMESILYQTLYSLFFCSGNVSRNTMMFLGGDPNPTILFTWCPTDCILSFAEIYQLQVFIDKALIRNDSEIAPADL